MPAINNYLPPPRMRCALAYIRLKIFLSPDRFPANELTTTQELIANMPGVRREGVTEVR